MNILLTIHHSLEVDSGAAGTTLELARAYEGLGHRTRVISFDDLPNRLPPQAKEIFFPQLVAAKLARRRRGDDIEVIDASSGDAWLWAALRRPGRGRPLLVTRSHGLEHTAYEERLREERLGNIELSRRFHLYRGGWRLREVALSLRKADLALVLNRDDRDYAIRNLGIDERRIHVVANGLPDFLLGRVAEELPSRNGSVRIAQVGGYLPRKGVHYGAPALAAVMRRHPECSLSFIGTGYPRERVLSDYDSELHERIRVVPRFSREELPGLLADHQIKVLPALSEGFGKSLLEAMACGLAPVSTSTAGPSDLIEHEVNGLLVPPRDSARLEAAIERLLNDRSLLERLRRNSLEAAQGYGWRSVAEKRLALYDEARRTRESISS